MAAPGKLNGRVFLNLQAMTGGKAKIQPTIQ